ncbi:unnamed protein product [Urochloa humidicola]
MRTGSVRLVNPWRSRPVLRPPRRIQWPAPVSRMTSWMPHRVAPSCCTDAAGEPLLAGPAASASADAAANSSSGRGGDGSSFEGGDGVACPAFRLTSRATGVRRAAAAAGEEEER